MAAFSLPFVRCYVKCKSTSLESRKAPTRARRTRSRVLAIQLPLPRGWCDCQTAARTPSFRIGGGIGESRPELAISPFASRHRPLKLARFVEPAKGNAPTALRAKENRGREGRPAVDSMGRRPDQPTMSFDRNSLSRGAASKANRVRRHKLIRYSF